MHSTTWHVVWCQEISTISFLLSANSVDETTVKFAVSIFETRGLFTQPIGFQSTHSTLEEPKFTDWMASIPGRSQGNWVSIARQNNNHDRGAAVCCRVDGGLWEWVSLGLNDLIDKIHVYFLNRVPAFCKSRHCGLGNELVLFSWLPFIHFSLLQREDSRWWPWMHRLKRIRNNTHTLGDQALAWAPGGASCRHGFCPPPFRDVQFLYSQWKVIFDHLVSAC